MKGFLRAEIYKTFHTKEYYYFLLLPLGVIAFVFYTWLKRTHNQYLSIASNFYLDKSPWHMYFNDFLFINMFFFPFLIVILVYINVDNEHNKKTWKYLFTLPYSDSYIFISKQVTCWLWIFLSLLLNFIVAICIGYILQYLNTNIPFASFNNHIATLLMIYLKIFLLSLPLVSIQLFLNIIIKGKLILFVILPIFSWISWTKFSPYNLIIRSVSDISLFNGKKYSFGYNISFFTEFELYGIFFLILGNILYFILRYKIINKLV